MKVMFNSLKKVFLAFLFIYFVSMIIIMGNGSSFMGRYFQPIYTPVANSIGLNTTWNFFSPDPAHIMYIKYVVFFDQPISDLNVSQSNNLSSEQVSTKDPIEGFYPESKGQGGDFHLSKKRDSYAMRFLVVDSNRIQNFFIPWICHKYSGATYVQVEVILNRIPSLDKVISVVNTGYEDYDNLISNEEISRYSYECPK